MNDGLWHSVSLESRDLQIAVGLDAEAPSTVELWQQLQPRGNIYFGGTAVFAFFVSFFFIFCETHPRESEVKVCFFPSVRVP